MTEPSSPYALAERVAEAARALEIETALIGAAALAVHNYVRGTADVDFATWVEPSKLHRLEQAVIALGLQARLALPDEDDPLGGVLKVWEQEGDDGEPLEPVEIREFSEPFSRSSQPRGRRDQERNDSGTLQTTLCPPP